MKPLLIHTSEFVPVTLEFLANDLVNRFALKNNKTLRQTIATRRYQHLASQVYDAYKQCLDMQLGDYLLTLKQSGDDFYKRFLNAYGDDTYCWFRIKDHLKDKGIYSYVIANSALYIGRCTDYFSKRINQGYGQIHPKNCYIDGQSTNCRLNSLINANHDKIQFYVCCMEDRAQIIESERNFIHDLQPQWNISLRQRTIL
ncbi:MAG: hypothetical protein CL610_11300 [Anaerolineaceae bacterium]|nr:hypothetical protein [Anaerolineaceae bacterium]